MFICLILELSSGDFYVTCFAIGALISIPVAEASGNQGKSDIFSDHPSDAKRIAALKAAMPTALKYYKPQGQTSVTSTTKTGVKTIKASSLMKKSTKK